MALAERGIGMSQADSEDAEAYVTYTFEIPQDTWYPWANNVPRQTNLDERLIELIEEDTDV